MKLEEWRKRPTYAAQVKTWNKAAELGLCCVHFRSPPGRRDLQAKLARDRVARAIRHERRQLRTSVSSLAGADRQAA